MPKEVFNMMLQRRVAAIMFLIAAPSVIQAQAVAESSRVRIGKYDDGFSSGIYAYVRGEEGIITSVEDDAIIFSLRDPVLVWACESGDIITVYRYDTEFVGRDNLVTVRYRFDQQAASPEADWPMLGTAISEAEIEMFMAMAGADTTAVSSNPMLNMMMGSAIAAQIPQELQEEFLTVASNANRVTLRVTDMDGETYTDFFSLSGFAEALDELKRVCP